MTKPLTQIGDQVREMTDDEYDALLGVRGELAAQQAAADAKAKTRAAAIAKLGLTADETNALFG